MCTVFKRCAQGQRNADFTNIFNLMSVMCDTSLMRVDMLASFCPLLCSSIGQEVING